MTNIPKDRLYTTTHEWIQMTNDIATIGITDHAQNELGDLVFVQLPDVGTQVTKSDELAVIESVKAASDLYAPLTGSVVEVNEALTDAPEEINQRPYDAWLVKIQIDSQADLSDLLDANAYEELL